jgi:hypothetical protein
MPAAHPPQFRRRAVELAREFDDDGKRVHPVAQLTRDLKISPAVRIHHVYPETSGARSASRRPGPGFCRDQNHNERRSKTAIGARQSVRPDLVERAPSDGHLGYFNGGGPQVTN